MKDLLHKIRRECAELLSPERCRHTLGVEELCAHFAGVYGADIDKCRLAALLHDIGKSVHRREEIDYCRENGIILTDADLHARGVVHSRISVHMARSRYGITDTDVLDAVMHHTTGAPGLGLTGLILFLSDYLDPGRDFKGQRRLLKTAEKGLKDGLLAVAVNKMCYVLSEQQALHPLAVSFYNWVLVTDFKGS